MKDSLLCMSYVQLVSWDTAPVLSQYVTYLTVETYIGHETTLAIRFILFVLRHSFHMHLFLRTNHLFSSTNHVSDDSTPVNCSLFLKNLRTFFDRRFHVKRVILHKIYFSGKIRSKIESKLCIKKKKKKKKSETDLSNFILKIYKIHKIWYI